MSRIKFVGMVPTRSVKTGAGEDVYVGNLYSGLSGSVQRFVVNARFLVLAPSISSVVSDKSSGRFNPFVGYNTFEREYDESDQERGSCLVSEGTAEMFDAIRSESHLYNAPGMHFAPVGSQAIEFSEFSRLSLA